MTGWFCLFAIGVFRVSKMALAGFGDPMEYEESVAPWNQQVALKTP
jgi:hypothetical protein